MTLSTATLVAQVNAELGNIEYVGSAEIEGDDQTAAFLVAPMHCSVTEDAYFTVYIDGSTTLNYVMDYVNGVCTMNTVPTAAQTVSWQFHYKHWTDVQVEDAVEVAAQMLFPSFYVSATEEHTGDDEETEFTLTGDIVTGVMWSSDGATPWMRYKPMRWEEYDEPAGRCNLAERLLSCCRRWGIN